MMLRAAFEGRTGVIQFAILCPGCWTELLEQARSEVKNVRCWSREMTGGHCEICIDHATREVL